MSRSARYCGQSGQAGKYNAPGMPEISGDFWDLASGADNIVSGLMGNASGAFRTGTQNHGGVQQASTRNTTSATNDGISFLASRSNRIYGASATVMPSSANLPVALYLGGPAQI